MAHKTSIFTVLLLALMGTSNLVSAAEQKDFYGIWFYKDNTYFEINKDSINMFVLNYHSHAALKYEHSIERWKKNDANEYYIYTLNENNSENLFRVYIKKGTHDLHIDNGYTEGWMKKSSAEELNKAINNTKVKIIDAPKKVAETETKTNSTFVDSSSAIAYKTISEVDIKMPTTEVKTNYTAFDSRDGKIYKVIKIASQIWMAENLNYEAKDSKCYENNESNCQIYGRLYNFATAKTACPEGWHLPTEAEWTKLTNSAGGEKSAGTVLKSKDGFFALPEGLGIPYKSSYDFRAAGYRGNWWTATEYAKGAYSWNINLNDAGVYKVSSDKTDLFSVRCVLD